MKTVVVFGLTTFCMILAIFSLHAGAVTLTLVDVPIAPATGQPYLPGQSFNLEIRIDTEDTAVNGYDIFLTWDGNYLAVQDKVPDVPDDASTTGIQPFLQGPFLGGLVMSNHTHGDLPGGEGSNPTPQDPPIPGIQGDYGEALAPGSKTGTGLVATLTFNVIAVPPVPPLITTIIFDFDMPISRETLISITTDPWSVRPTAPPKDIALPVTLSAFDASWVPEGVRVRWTAETEQSNLGWDIFRSEEPSGEYVKINPAIVKGAGDSVKPTEYIYLDEEAVNGKTYYYYIESIDFFGKSDRSPIIMVSKEKPPVIKPTVIKPSFPMLLPNYPNPFNPQTWLPFQLTAPSKVTIRIYNLYGHLVKALDLGYREAGFYIGKNESAYWDGTDETGKLAASGVYFYRLDAGRFSAVRRMVLLK